MIYFVYILKCKDNSLYCGYTNDLEKRIKAHNYSKTAAKYTKMRRPVDLTYFEIFEEKIRALNREREIKKLKREQKLRLLYFNNKAGVSTSVRPTSL